MILWQGGPLNFDLPVTRTKEDSRDEVKPSAKPVLLTRDELKRQERDAIVIALKKTNGKVSGRNGAAELLGMKPTTLAAHLGPRLKSQGPELKRSRFAPTFSAS